MPAEKKQYAIIKSFLNADMKESYLRAILRSHLIDDIFPDFKKIRGLVQHDQYHQYSYDTHIGQALQLVLQTKKRPKELGIHFK